MEKLFKNLGILEFVLLTTFIILIACVVGFIPFSDMMVLNNVIFGFASIIRIMKATC